MKHAATCLICSSPKVYYVFSVQQYRLLECQECGHLMLFPQPCEEHLQQIYGASYALLNANDEERAEFAGLKRATSRYYLDLIGQYRGHHGGRLLEVGCGKGDLLTMASELGYDVTGVEYSPHSCAVARAKLQGKGRVVQGELSDLAGDSRGYDVCVLADVIEHVRDPRSFLARVHALLKPEGVIFIATPSLDTWSAKLLKYRWMEFKPEHLHYFSQNTLHSLLFQTGFHRALRLPGKKFLNFDYILQHFVKYPVPKITLALKLLETVLPRALRRKHLRVVASGMIVLASRTVVREPHKLSIVMPAYNEAATLEPVLQALLQKDLDPLEKEVILVESNSSDGTRDIVLKYRSHPQVKVILEDRPMGKGHAVRAGLQHATGDFVLIQDADVEYDLEDYEVLLEPLLKGRHAFVLGSRHGGRTWKLRQFKGKPLASALFNVGHWLFKTLLNVLYRMRLKDPFTMYKVFRRDCLTGLRFECNFFDFDHEIVIKLARKGYVPIEIPVNYRARSFKEGKKVSIVRDPWTWLRAIFKFRFSALHMMEHVQMEREAAGYKEEPKRTIAQSGLSS